MLLAFSTLLVGLTEKFQRYLEILQFITFEKFVKFFLH